MIVNISHDFVKTLFQEIDRKLLLLLDKETNDKKREIIETLTESNTGELRILARLLKIKLD